MKKLSLVAALSALVLSTLAHVPSAGAVGVGENIEWVGTVPLTNDSAGAIRHGDWFYVTTSTTLQIYDISDPVSPSLMSVLPFVQSPQFAQEDLDTNGEILLIDDSVIDVSDKANPEVLSTHGGSSHTITCILDCTWAYASNGRIIDLTDPANPRTTDSRWNTETSVTSSHDVTEIAPGLVVTSSDPVIFLDAREDPEHPVLIGEGPKRNRFTHSNLWPHEGQDKFLLVSGEGGNLPPGPCDGPSDHFVTMDATEGWPTYDEDGNLIKLGTFTPLGEYRVGQGLPTEGQSPANQWCTHWFDPHPTYRDGGLVAMAWYEHGVRMLDIQDDGSIEETGWYVPVGGMTSDVNWITDRIMYATDYQRSVDIFRYTGPLPGDS